MNIKVSRFRTVVLILLIFMGLANVVLAGEQITQPTHTIKLWIGSGQALVDGKTMNLDTPPILYNGTTMVPLRFVAEAMGATVKYDPTEQKIMITGSESGPAEKTQFDVILRIGKNEVLVNGEQKTISVPPMLYNGRTMVPLRFIAETMGANIEWNSVEKSVTITWSTNELGRICVFKFNDVNGNGKQDNGEPALPGWTIIIKDPSGNVISKGETNKEGYYCVDVKPNNTYTISEVLQTGWSQTYPVNPDSYTVTVKPGETINVTFGNQEKHCCLSFQFNAGQDDKFVPGNSEPACCLCNQSVVDWCYKDWNQYHPGQNFPGFTDFDATKGEKWFAQCFTLPMGNCIQSAKLTFLAKPLAGNSSNDTITFIIGNNHWTYYFGSYNNAQGLLSNPWNTYPLQPFQIDLSNLPGNVNLLSSLDSERNLGIVIQDDTSVDYMKLDVTFCECSETLVVEPVPNAEITVEQIADKPILKPIKCNTNDKGEFSFSVPEEEFKNLPNEIILELTITPPNGWTGISSSNVVIVKVEKSNGPKFDFVLLWQREKIKTNKGSFAINAKTQS